MVNYFPVGCGQRIVWAATQAIRALSHSCRACRKHLTGMDTPDKKHLRTSPASSSVRGCGRLLTAKWMRLAAPKRTMAIRRSCNAIRGLLHRQAESAVESGHSVACPDVLDMR